jgi:hypothetical protein
VGTTPFRTFHGYLKRHAHEQLTALEQELFDVLFPAFQGTPDAEGNHIIAQKTLAASQECEKIQLVRPEPRPRRYSGYNLGRRRYFTVCADAGGYDAQTLAHEMRAYRDPIDLGMVEVVDLAAGPKIVFGDMQVPLDPQPAFAVLIHEPGRLAAKFHELPFQKVPGLKGQPCFIFRFPYLVTETTIERTVDLRDPEVRDWFFSTFHHPCDVCGAQVAPLAGTDVSPTTAYSRFHFENGRAPAPDSFWAMLPTLINPDLGGGNLGDTGSTLVMIGHWMRQNRVHAFVFPSARCDIRAVVKDGVLSGWQGWNLLDYRDSPIFDAVDAEVLTVVVSPWAWTQLPDGVRLHLGEANSELAGSFAIEGMVNYWAQDYLSQLKGLELARARHGEEPPRDKRTGTTEGLAYRAFEIGILSLRWTRMLVHRTPIAEVDDVVLQLQGLALPYGLYPATGRIMELWSGIKKGTLSLLDAVNASQGSMDLVCRTLAKRYPRDELDKVARLGADLEWMLLLIPLRAMAGSDESAAVSGPDYSAFLKETEVTLATAWLCEDLKNRARAYFDRTTRATDRTAAETKNDIDEGEKLLEAIDEYLLEKPNSPT